MEKNEEMKKRKKEKMMMKSQRMKVHPMNGSIWKEKRMKFPFDEHSFHDEWTRMKNWKKMF